MQRGVDAPPEIKAQALALYAETGTSTMAAARMWQLGLPVDPTTISRWARTADGFTQELQAKRKEVLTDIWYGVAKDGATRASQAIKRLKDDQVTVPAAIATDKYLKLTEESPASSTPTVSVFVGVQVNK